MDSGLGKCVIVAAIGEEHDVTIGTVASHPKVPAAGIKTNPIVVVSRTQYDVAIGTLSASKHIRLLSIQVNGGL